MAHSSYWESAKAQTLYRCVPLFLPALQQLSFSSAPIFRNWHCPLCPVYCLLATQALLPVCSVKESTLKFHQLNTFEFVSEKAYVSSK